MADSVSVAIPIAYGSFSQSIAKGTDPLVPKQATHRWTLFLRGPSGEDLSPIVSKVAFALHPSFALPIREVTAAPFEVTEYGWGEFECAIRVFWQDPAEQPIDLHHLLKLYHTEGPASKKPVMSEKYDEVVFTSPDPHFLRLLRSYGVPGLGAAAGSSGSSSFSDYYTDFSDAADLQRLTEVQGSLKAQIEVAKATLIRLDADIGGVLDKAEYSAAAAKQ